MTLVLSMFIGARVRAQLPVHDTAAVRMIGAEFLDAVTAARWRDAASVLDLDQLESARQERARAERDRRRARAVTVSQLLRTNPDMPRSVAVYEVKQRAKQQREMNYLRLEFGVGDPDSLLALPIESVASRWVEAHDQRSRNRELQRGCSHSGEDEKLPAPTYHIVSTAVEGDQGYVLFVDMGWHAGIDPLYAPPPRVMQLRRTPKGWRISPRWDLIGLPEMVNACG